METQWFREGIEKQHAALLKERLQVQEKIDSAWARRGELQEAATRGTVAWPAACERIASIERAIEALEKRDAELDLEIAAHARKLERLALTAAISVHDPTAIESSEDRNRLLRLFSRNSFGGGAAIAGPHVMYSSGITRAATVRCKVLRGFHSKMLAGGRARRGDIVVLPIAQAAMLFHANALELVMEPQPPAAA